MINKIIYTYNTYKGTNYNQGFPSFKDFIYFYKHTLKETNNYYKNIVIYTDTKGKDILLNNNINYDIEIIDFDLSYNKGFDNYSKFISISLQDEPFLHIDNDIILKGEIPKDCLESDIICEKRRPFYLKNKEEFNYIKDITSNKIYKYNNIICSGIIGGNNLEVFKERFEISKPKFYDLDDDITFYKMIALEEILLTYLVDKYKLNVKEIPKSKFIHFQGDKKGYLKDFDSFEKLKNLLF